MNELVFCVSCDCEHKVSDVNVLSRFPWLDTDTVSFRCSAMPRYANNMSSEIREEN